MNKISQNRVKKYNANRFTACLLAVLMLFSVLWAGIITVQAETDVAQDVAKIVGGESYTSLEAAVESAGTPESAVEIDLIADAALAESITIGNNITLDLNGHTLNLGSYDLSLSTSAKVVDSVGTGLLTTSSGKFNSTTQMAVYNTTKSGYVVADVKHQEKILSEAGTGEFTLVFKPDFGTTANSLLGNSGTDAEVSIRILLSYDGGDDIYFTYTSDMIKDVYKNSGKAFYITVTNFANVSNVKVTPLITSSVGAGLRGTAYALTEVTDTTVAVESVTLDKSSLEIVVGNTATLTATVAPDTATDKTVTWSSNATDVATVDANGKVTAVKPGTATITAATDNGKTATCEVTVKPNGYITVTEKDGTTAAGEYGTYSLSGNSKIVVMDVALRAENGLGQVNLITRNQNNVDTTLFKLEAYEDGTDKKYGISRLIGSSWVKGCVELSKDEWTEIRIVLKCDGSSDNVILYTFNGENYKLEGTRTVNLTALPKRLKFETTGINGASLHLDNYSVYTTLDTDYTSATLPEIDVIYKQDYNAYCAHDTEDCPAKINGTSGVRRGINISHVSEPLTEADN